jgi:hypothetical protein
MQCRLRAEYIRMDSMYHHGLPWYEVHQAPPNHAPGERPMPQEVPGMPPDPWGVASTAHVG